MYRLTIKSTCAALAFAGMEWATAQVPPQTPPVAVMPTGAPVSAPGTSPAATEQPRFQMPENIAESAEAARREAIKKAKEDQTPVKPSSGDRGGPAGATAPNQGQFPTAPRIVVPFQDMRLVALLEVDGKRLAGVRINGNTNYVVTGASIGNGWQVQTIDRTSVVVVRADPDTSGKKSKVSSSAPRIQTLMLDALPVTVPTAQGQQPSQTAAMPVPFR